MSRVAVVTGASAGVGRATAVELARRGYDVALVARGRAGLDAAAAEVAGAGRTGLVVEADVADEQQVRDALRQAEELLGPVDAWVNDAMTTVFDRAVDVDPADFRRAVEVTFLGQVWGTMAALSSMRPRDHGTIVNVGSALAYLGIPLQSAYCASKFACRGFFESVRAELLHDGSSVQLRMVHLPAVNTPQFDWCRSGLAHEPQPVPPIYQPEVAAAAIADAVEGGPPSRVLGSWNRVVVAAAQLAPMVAVRYAAATCVDAQLGDEHVAADRPSNLRSPVDTHQDHGARGRFGGRAAGALDPSFLRTLPRSVGQLGGAVIAAARDRLGV